MTEVTPEMVLQLTKPTDGFLCPLSANKYGIEFLSFAIIDYATKKVIFQVGTWQFYLIKQYLFDLIY